MSATRASKRPGKGGRGIYKEAGESTDGKDTGGNNDDKDTGGNKDKTDTDKAKDISSYTVLRVYKFDPSTQASSHKRLLQVESMKFAKIEDGTLVDLRQHLIKEQVLDSQE